MKAETFADRIEAAKHDAAELGRIADELWNIPGADIARLRLRAISFKMAATSAFGQITTLPSPVPSWLAELGLPRIDGRPLHRYRLSDRSFTQLERDLRTQKRSLRFDPTPILAASFVLWAAEWFRRSYDGTGRRWDALGAALGLEAEWVEWQRLADMGLKHWRIPELRIRGKHYRLAAIARQGGFPAAAVEGKGAGWAPRFLERLVGLLLGEKETNIEAADAIAARLMEMVPETWRSEEIRFVSVELAVEIVKLRRLVEDAGLADGSLASAWLDSNRKDWRDELPIRISSATCRALVDGLMKIAALRGGAGAVRVERKILLLRDGRRERVELMLTGDLRGDNGRAIDYSLANEWNRLRLVPSGTFAQYAGGELATAEPGDGGAWVARASLTSASFDLPTEVEVTAELRGGGQRVGQPFILPGGQAVAAAVRVYGVEEGQELNEGTEIVMLGTGSGSYRPERLLVDLNADWTCAAHGESASCEPVLVGRTETRRLWGITGTAIAVSATGDRYLIRAGQKGDSRDRLILFGRQARGYQYLDSTLPIFLGSPELRLNENGRDRAAYAGELWWRKNGARDWRSDTPAAGPGICDFAWRDARTGHIRSSKEAVILPVGFMLERRRNGDSFELGIVGWPGTADVESGVKSSEASWRFSVRESSRSSCVIRLLGISEPILLRTAVPHVPWIFDWNGSPLTHNGKVSLASISQFVARTDGRCQLFAELLDRHRRPIPQGTTSWWVEDELPLSAIRSEIAALLRPQGNLDASVKINFNGEGYHSWYVSEFDQELKPEGNGWVVSKAVLDGAAQVSGRALHAPADEKNLGEYSLVTDLNHRPLKLPALDGDWIVYVRSGARVLSRPRLIHGDCTGADPTGSLGRAMTIIDLEQRQAGLRELINAALQDLGRGRDLVRQITELALSLNGLPPSTFDILSLLRDESLLSAMLLFQASPDEIEPLMQLSEGLPLEWSLISSRCWDEAARLQAEYVLSKVPDHLALVADHISNRRKLIVEFEPSLAAMLGLRVERHSLACVANAFLNRSDDQIEELPNPFRPLRNMILPRWQMDEHFWRALDAPVVAALAARERLKLDPAEITCIKNISRRHPRWFREGFHAVYLEH